jgi:hypothetical protein
MPSNLLPSFDAITAAFGVSATVRRPTDLAAIVTQAVWLPPVARTDLPGQEMGRAAPGLVLAIPRADVATAPAGTVIVAAPLEGGTARAWLVQRLLDAIDHDHLRVTVTAARSEG